MRDDVPGLPRIRVGDVVAALGPDLRPGAEQFGVDDAGVVKVRVTAEGGVSGVEIAGRFPGVDALAAAILGAYRQALLKRMAARLVHGAGPAAAPDVTDERWLAWLRDALDRADRQLTAMGRARPYADEFTGPGHCVRVRVAGGVVTDVFIDAPRPPEVVAADARSALDQAAQALPRA
ncbi:hypothetical protein GCM10010168_25080 [Actinoplanes ianthinogenes]|uniref:Uncharacterized protein n=1 Tax=Actinoplanes ianthinogenes TaxID=122358 RepID=A0ABN6CSD0_9ACTN|nr:hypothetical protein [Actinoplanes ianthinogenes]BCJ48148.1 hypothetical protein Aiant_88050 [Actinoplanes ianthinogenes]GGR06772.1 hypothetical protein GCM10010168_25080 [Actinoplanes ianthinogenes]